MGGSRKASLPRTTNCPDGGIAREFAEIFRAIKALADPYRPELHYMRGPGPKWRAKNDAAREAMASHAGLASAKG